MTSTKLHELIDIGQSVWLDYLQRSLITSGGLREYTHKGLRGVTSNPSIFADAISNSDDYDDRIQQMALQNTPVSNMYELLIVKDIQMATDVLRPIYDETDGEDGYVSLEVNPQLAHDTERTIFEARHLWRSVDRPNLMIKVPATSEGFLAIQRLIEGGYNINVTLMFSLDQYDLVAEAYLSGLEKRLENGQEIDRVASVASFFVSRIDVKIDPMLDILDVPEADDLKGKIGIASAKMAYQRFQETFAGKRWERLAEKGAKLQRVLYGSTSTKNPDYPDTLYIDNLIGPDTINTVPPSTLEAFLDHGTVSATLPSDLAEAELQLNTLEELGIHLGDVSNQLLREGVDKFTKSYETLIARLAEKKAESVTARLGNIGSEQV